MRGRRQVSRHASRLIALGVAVLLAALLVGCGMSDVQGTAQGTLAGTVVASPGCPVEQMNNPCPPIKVANRQVTIKTSDGATAATTTTDADGHFSVSLAPGTYTVLVEIIPGQVGIGAPQLGLVTVTAGQTTTVQIVLDSGIR